MALDKEGEGRVLRRITEARGGKRDGLVGMVESWADEENVFYVMVRFCFLSWAILVGS